MDRGRAFESYYNQKRKKKQARMFLKMIGIILGLVALFACMLSGIRIVTGLDRKADAIGQEEAAILLRALYEEVLPPEDEGREAEYEQALGILMENGEEALTYASYHELLNYLPDGEKPAEGGRGKQPVGRKAFYSDYFSMVAQYGLQEVIQRRQLTLLAAEDVVLPGLEIDEAEGGAIAVAEDGNYLDKSGGAGGYLFRPFGGVVKLGGELPQLLAAEEKPEEGAAYTIHNIWLMETLEGGIRCFWNDAEFTVKLPQEVWEKNEIKREQVADISFVDGEAEQVTCKREKISGKILGIGDNMIEVEGAGTLFLADNLKIYKLYGTLERCYTSDLRVGYAFTDFVLEDGKVAACLIMKDEAMENIRVLIQAGNYEGKFHEKVELTCDTGYEIIYGEKSEEKQAGERLEITPESSFFEGQGRVLVKPEALTGRIRLESVSRSQGTPEYRGTLEIIKNSDGMFVVNEVLLEEYLYAVVPSEMPSSYPMEALKVQAVCARTYAYKKMEQAGLARFGAHVDDSTTYQVYNNILENAQTTKAVKETEGLLLQAGGQTADTFYYSTSCGFGTNAEIWKGGNGSELSYLVPRHIAAEDMSGEGDAGIGIDPQQMTDEAAFRAYIESVGEQDFEHGQPWYRWSYTVEEMDRGNLEERLRNRYQLNKELVLTEEEGEYVPKEIKELGDIRDIRVVKRGPGGIIDELVIEGSSANIKVITEQNVRYVLCNSTQDKVLRQDGSEGGASTLLPSSFFVINLGKEGDIVIGYKIIGGGYGHGVGMSQNGAKEMADAGMDAEEIITFFYDGVELADIYGE